MEPGRLQELQEFQGSWTDQALLQPMTTEARGDGPGKGSDLVKIGRFVGPNAARWIGCRTPPGNARLPQGFQGVQFPIFSLTFRWTVCATTKLCDCANVAGPVHWRKAIR